MKKFGLIGYPLGHSFSRSFFSDKFNRENLNCSYENFEIKSINELHPLLKKSRAIVGLNVTIPYKRDVIELLNDIDPDAAKIGAVNVIKIIRTGNEYRLKGYNTDMYGFTESVKPLLTGKGDNISALLLGTGGASLAVKEALNQLGIEFTTVSRSPGKGDIVYEQVTEEVLTLNRLIINTTPLGMSPDIDSAPDIPYRVLTNRHILFDLVYNPSETKFMRLGKSEGALVVNGLIMLHLQAQKSWEIWNSGVKG
ncbi:MAG: shikimate dehydrogenase [Bacteroidales bacterium]|nr:shikimate dehydrogenase [Bacteroidales bacterium]